MSDSEESAASKNEEVKTKSEIEEAEGKLDHRGAVPSTLTLPHDMIVPRIEENDGVNALIAWDAPNPQPQFYEIMWSGGDQTHVEKTEESKFRMTDMIPGYQYTISISTSTGALPGSVKIISCPLAPRHVQVVHNELSRSNSIRVIFQGADKRSNRYRVTIVDTEEVEDDRVEETQNCFHTFRELQPGQTYGVFVQSILEGKPDILSSKSYSEITTYPGNVANLKFTDENIPTLTWDHPTHEAVKYYVKISSDSDERAYETTQRKKLLRNLVSGQFYIAEVAAVNSVGTGESSFVTFDSEPAKVTGLQVDNFKSSPHNSLLVTFDDMETDATTFIVHAKLLGHEDDKPTETTGCHVVLNDLIPGSKYEIYVITRRGERTSLKSFYRDLAHTYPDMIKDVKAEEEDGRLCVTWEEPVVVPLKYKVYITRNEETKVVEADANNFTIKHVLPSSIYCIAVAAENEAGIGKKSKITEVHTNPSPPFNVEMRHNPDAPKTSMIITFQDRDMVTKRYKITARSTTGSEIKEIKTTQHFATLWGLDPGHSYYVGVVAIMGSGGDERMSGEVYCVPRKGLQKTTKLTSSFANPQASPKNSECSS